VADHDVARVLEPKTTYASLVIWLPPRPRTASSTFGYAVAVSRRASTYCVVGEHDSELLLQHAVDPCRIRVGAQVIADGEVVHEREVSSGQT
jgi:hypothetical protein